MLPIVKTRILNFIHSHLHLYEPKCLKNVLSNICLNQDPNKVHTLLFYYCFFMSLISREIRLSVLKACPKFDLLLPGISFIFTYYHPYILHTGSLIRFRFNLWGGQSCFIEHHIRNLMIYGVSLFLVLQLISGYR